MNKRAILQCLNFGERVAEEESEALQSYFVETNQWGKLFRGEVDIIYGPKGSGKSALYALLLSKETELKAKGILLTAAENPRGTPAFRNLLTDPPADDRELLGFWKLYFVSLIQGALSDHGINSPEASEITKPLEEEGLIRGKSSLSRVLRSVMNYARKAFRPGGIEAGIDLDPLTGTPKGFRGKITFSEPLAGEAAGLYSVDFLLKLANQALGKSGHSLWILLDRLDVAFSDTPSLEVKALKALFRGYLDIVSSQSMKLKIFLRSDIWIKITLDGFREASHITRSMTIKWNAEALLDLVVRRILHNELIRSSFDPLQSRVEFLYRICPNQIDVGASKPKTFDWILSRTCDGLKVNSPRELIHFFTCLRDVQLDRFERGEDEETSPELFARPAFKEALPEVSRSRLEQTLLAEYSSQKVAIEKLRGAEPSPAWSILRFLIKLLSKHLLFRKSNQFTFGDPNGYTLSPGSTLLFGRPRLNSHLSQTSNRRLLYFRLAPGRITSSSTFRILVNTPTRTSRCDPTHHATGVHSIRHDH